MRILCLAFSCGVLLAADTGGAAALPNGGSVSVSAQATGLVLQVHDRPRLTPQMVLGVDSTVAPGSSPDIKVIGEATPGVVILEDTYYSKPGTLSYCQAGKEQFLRVLDLAKPGRESLRVKVSSCIGDLELDDPGGSMERGGQITRDSLDTELKGGKSAQLCQIRDWLTRQSAVSEPEADTNESAALAVGVKRWFFGAFRRLTAVLVLRSRVAWS